MTASPNSKTAVRGAMMWFKADPFSVPDDSQMADCVTYESDGLLVIEDGRITASGPADVLLPTLAEDTAVTRFENKLIMPGFIDAHNHYAQLQIIGSYGKQLLDWLKDYTFPAEEAFSDTAHAAEIADLFCGELLSNGTTTAASFCTSHPASVDALFHAASSRNMRIIAGKVMMDRNAPEGLLDTVETAYSQSLELIERWHEKGRNHYALTPRFAVSCSPEQLEMAGSLRREHERLYVQSHLSENLEEIDQVQKLFPNRTDYLDIYNHYGLTGERSLYGHGVHLTPAQWQDIKERGTGLVHCPTSNLFLGSGLFDLKTAMKAPAIPLALGSDVGAGTSLSMLTTMGAAYKISQLQGYAMNALKAFYLATLGAAKTLSLDAYIGSLEAGKDADFIVLDPSATPLIKARLEPVSSLEETLFVLMTMGDDRAVAATYIAGKKLYSKNSSN